MGVVVTAAQAAQLLGVSRELIGKLAELGLLAPVGRRPLRFYRQEIEEVADAKN